jgi:hypothetical protein
MCEACGTGTQPMAVYATDKAMSQDPIPLPDALKTFVRLDNRLFKQELLQSTHNPNQAGGSSFSHKRSAGLPGDDGGLQSKRLQRSSSMDSMATNQASAGGSDDEGMRDAPFDSDGVFGVAVWNPSSPEERQGGSADGAAPQDESIPDLVDVDVSPPPPPQQLSVYANDVEMETGVSPTLAQVTLGESKEGGSPPTSAPAEEMRERPNAGFVTRPNHIHSGGGDGAAPVANGGAAAGEEEPLIDLGDGSDVRFKDRVNGF